MSCVTALAGYPECQFIKGLLVAGLHSSPHPYLKFEYIMVLYLCWLLSTINMICSAAVSAVCVSEYASQRRASLTLVSLVGLNERVALAPCKCCTYCAFYCLTLRSTMTFYRLT